MFEKVILQAPGKGTLGSQLFNDPRGGRDWRSYSPNDGAITHGIRRVGTPNPVSSD
jgi:hypothetical protein